MVSDFTTPAHKLSSASANPLPSPGQGKTRPCLPLQGQPQPLLTHRRAAALLCPVPTQPTPALAPASAIPAVKAVHILHGHHKLGQTKPTPGFTREMNLGGDAERRDLVKTRPLLGETSRAIAQWRILVLISPLTAPFKLIR